MHLNDFFAALDNYDRSVPIDELVDLMKQVSLSRADIEEHIRFDDVCYKRNLLRIGSGYAALILCWKAGQASPIHDHRGSACGVRVISGHASETQFKKRDDGSLEISARNEYPGGHVCGSCDADIHILANEQPEGELLTLHVYTPPLENYRVYTRSGEFTLKCDEEALAAMRQRDAAGVN